MAHALLEAAAMSTYRAAGRAAAAFVAVAGLAACFDQDATFPQLRVRAARDLACGPETYEIRPIDARTVAVRACGREAVYVSSCEQCSDPFAKGGRTYACSCTWRQDGPILDVAPAGADARPL